MFRYINAPESLKDVLTPTLLFDASFPIDLLIHPRLGIYWNNIEVSDACYSFSFRIITSIREGNWISDAILSSLALVSISLSNNNWFSDAILSSLALVSASIWRNNWIFDAPLSSLLHVSASILVVIKFPMHYSLLRHKFWHRFRDVAGFPTPNSHFRHRQGIKKNQRGPKRPRWQ